MTPEQRDEIIDLLGPLFAYIDDLEMKRGQGLDVKEKDERFDWMARNRLNMYRGLHILKNRHPDEWDTAFKKVMK